jgi:plasmid stabilization system protein ParE
MIIKWSPAAIQDLDETYGFYAKKSLQTAAMLYNSIIDEAEILKSQPYIAAVDLVFEDFTEVIRSLLVSKRRFKIVYHIENETVYVLRVWDCRQNPERLKQSLCL